MTLGQLVLKMASVLRFEDGKGNIWHARAQGSSKFHSSASIKEALENAYNDVFDPMDDDDDL